MKTAERILATALALFNEHGESTITSVDIANECEISPGNLYYHFKGKEQLVTGLIKLHRAQMHELLDNQNVHTLGVEDMFYYFLMLAEKMQLFRFLYRSPMDLQEKYPIYTRSHVKMLHAMEQSVSQILRNCVAQQTLCVKDTSVAQLAQLIKVIMIQSCFGDGVNNRSDNAAFNALSLLMCALLPRCELPEKIKTALLSVVESHQLPHGGSIWVTN